MAVIDQYGVGIVVLTAGSCSTASILYEAMLSTFLPAVEEEARAQAQKYVGNFTLLGDDLVKMDTSMDDDPGIRLDALRRNGSDVLGALPAFFAEVLPQFGTLAPEFRIFPAEIEEEDVILQEGKNISVIREDWRIGLDFSFYGGAESMSELPGQGVYQGFCGSWEAQDWFYYGGQAVDRIVFVLDKETRAVLGVDVPFLRANLTRSDEVGFVISAPRSKKTGEEREGHIARTFM